jgi:hypothetical protein
MKSLTKYIYCGTILGIIFSVWSFSDINKMNSNLGFPVVYTFGYILISNLPLILLGIFWGWALYNIKGRKEIEQTKSEEIKIPKGIFIISIFNYILSAVSSLIAIMLERILFLIKIDIKNIFLINFLFENKLGIISLRIIFLSLAILFFFLAKEIKNKKYWVKTTIIVLYTFIIILLITFYIFQKDFSNIYFLLIPLLILCYLLFSKTSKEFFS